METTKKEDDVRTWLRQNGHPQIATLIDEIISEWKSKGKRTRRNWWDVLAGGSNGEPLRVAGRQFPILDEAKKRRGERDSVPPNAAAPAKTGAKKAAKKGAKKAAAKKAAKPAKKAAAKKAAKPAKKAAAKKAAKPAKKAAAKPAKAGKKAPAKKAKPAKKIEAATAETPSGGEAG